jgi:type IV fimbrial biogenesis protein FimT
MRRSEGLTLIELMVTLAVGLIVLAVGVPAYDRITANNRVTAANNSLVTHFTLARSEAVKRAGPVTICASNDQATCSGSDNWEAGWIVFTDEGTSKALDGTDEMLRAAGAQPAGITILAGSAAIRFLPDGSADG